MGAEDAPASLVALVTDEDPAVGLRAVLAPRLLAELEPLRVDARRPGWSSQNRSRETVLARAAQERL
ncbi:hypothetical protein [Streptomyces subrutilus]|uniref:Uncharacterized protein n=1 Tax=Streptomyces subrutilus TaxID=36818 RepID=A0A1E5Q069_9ACTN|nr:hypothetical protein [Streptomyces subrutilus]OEJ35197.1 hypothetical protein BGK67_31270 [Streptomyces subrutilus]